METKIDTKELKKLIKISLDCGSDPTKEFGSIFAWGPPGIGKSGVVAQVATEEKVGFVDMRLVLCDPTDLRGIPMPAQDDKGEYSAMWIPPDELPKTGRGILFFDDFVTAPPLVQASAYQITIPPHQLGQYKLPPGWVIVAAGNTMQDRSLAHRMPKALSNRFTHVWLEANVDTWVDWAFKAGISPNIIGFLKWRPELLHNFKAESSEEAFPTPRSWEFADRTLKHIPARGLQNTVLSGQVGSGAAAEFGAFLKIQNELPPLENIFGGDNTVPQKLDLKYALVAALATRAQTHQFNRLVQYSEFLPEEFSILMVKMLISRDFKAVSQCPAIITWSQKRKDITLL